MPHDVASRIAADDLAHALDTVLELSRAARTLPDELVDPDVRQLAQAFHRAVEAGVVDVAHRLDGMDNLTT